MKTIKDFFYKYNNLLTVILAIFFIFTVMYIGYDTRNASVNLEEHKNIKDEFQTENGQTYLTAIDPYFYYRSSLEYHLNGHTGNTLIENDSGEMVPHSSLKTAPKGSGGTYEPRFHVWMGAQILNLNGVDEDSSHGEGMGAVFIVSSLFAVLAAIPAFLIIRRFSNDLYAFIGTLFILLQSTFVSRTVTGFFDTDPFGVIFPLFVSMFIILSFFFVNHYLVLVLAIIAGFFQGLAQWAWGNNWFISLAIIATLVGYLGYLLGIDWFNKWRGGKEKIVEKKTDDIKRAGIVFGGYIVSSAFFVWLLKGGNLLGTLISAPRDRLRTLYEGTTADVWPNVLTSVAELKNLSLDEIAKNLGGNQIGIGNIFIFLGLMGLVFLFMDFSRVNKKNTNSIYSFSSGWFFVFIFLNTFSLFGMNNIPLFIILLFLPVGIALLYAFYYQHISQKVLGAILLTVWFAGTLFMSFSGVRFTLLLAAPVGLTSAIGLYYIGRTITEFIGNELEVKNVFAKNIPGTVIMIIFAFLLISPIYSHAQDINQSNLPNFDDGWYDSMEYIRENTDEDAIITSWWDFGHYFAAIGERGVTFDGASQTTPPAHWVGKLLIEDDPEVSQDILRMLSCGWNDAHERIMEAKGYEEDTDKYAAGEVKSIDLIYKTFGKEREEKVDVLENYSHNDFTDKDVNNIMDALYCEEPPQTVLITSGDMIGKAPVWGHWGTWNFDKKYVHDRYKSQSVEEMAEAIDRDKETIQQYVDELEEINAKAKNEGVSKSDLINEWYSPYPQQVGTLSCQGKKETLSCQSRLGTISINLTNGNTTPSSLQQRSIRTVVVEEENKTQTHEIDSKGDLDIVVPKSRDKIEVMQAPHGASLFTNLYILDGKGNEYFKEMYSTNTLTTQEVILWNATWR